MQAFIEWLKFLQRICMYEYWLFKAIIDQLHKTMYFKQFKNKPKQGNTLSYIAAFRMKDVIVYK